MSRSLSKPAAKIALSVGVITASVSVIFIFVVALVGIEAIWTDLSRPSRDEAMRAGADASRPVIAALAAYHTAHGRYPDRLDELVTDGLIDRIPELPKLGGSRRSELTYEVSQPVDLFRLYFSYDIPEGPYAPGSIIGFTYLSDEREWVGRKYGTSLWYEASERAARRWREKRDVDSLSTFVRVAAMKPEHDSIYARRVEEWLGDGEAGSIPPSIPGAGDTCTIYRVAGAGKGYGFSYPRDPEDHFGEKPEYKLLSRIYEITGSGRDESWRIVWDRNEHHPR